MIYTIIDVETTGKSNRMTEIAIFKYDGSTIIEEFTSLVNPQIVIPDYITALTGIDTEMVSEAPLFSEIADAILKITEDAVFVAHNVNFDYNVIKGEFNRLQIPFRRKKLCTVRLSRKLLPGHRSYSLGKLCTALDIPLVDRHRARGDAEATVKLFELLLAQEHAQQEFARFIKANSRQATLPAHLPDAVFDAIPNAPGIYYFSNKKGKTLYVGKAKDLKKRVLGHFYDKKQKELDLCRETAHIDFELSGSELIALLMEDAAIKKHYPKYNVASKKNSRAYGIFSYTDRNGIMHLAFNTLKHCPNPLQILYNKTEIITYLENYCMQFELCPKFCHLQENVPYCSHYKIVTCKGVCKNEESIFLYNFRVKKAIAHMKTSFQDTVIKRPGRTVEEQGFVLVKDGIYAGYGFVKNEEQITTTSALEPFLIPQKDTMEVQRILKKALVDAANKELLINNHDRSNTGSFGRSRIVVER